MRSTVDLEVMSRHPAIPRVAGGQLQNFHPGPCEASSPSCAVFAAAAYFCARTCWKNRTAQTASGFWGGVEVGEEAWESIGAVSGMGVFAVRQLGSISFISSAFIHRPNFALPPWDERSGAVAPLP